MSIIGVLLSLFAFGVLIISHEFGHFLLAKLNGICVEEFSVGMGPRLLSWQGKETRYSLKAVPFGGSCMMLGEDEECQDERAFGSKNVWARISVLAAGPVFNFILAYVLSIFIIGSIGYDQPVIRVVYEDYSAAEAGLQAGDTITKINGKRIKSFAT